MTCAFYGETDEEGVEGAVPLEVSHAPLAVSLNRDPH